MNTRDQKVEKSASPATVPSTATTREKIACMEAESKERRDAALNGNRPFSILR